MAITPDEMFILQKSLNMLYVSLRLHEEALIHFVCHKFDLPYESVERELNEWTLQHQDQMTGTLHRESRELLRAAGFPVA